MKKLCFRFQKDTSSQMLKWLVFFLFKQSMKAGNLDEEDNLLWYHNYTFMFVPSALGQTQKSSHNFVL